MKIKMEDAKCPQCGKILGDHKRMEFMFCASMLYMEEKLER